MMQVIIELMIKLMVQVIKLIMMQVIKVFGQLTIIFWVNLSLKILKNSYPFISSLNLIFIQKFLILQYIHFERISFNNKNQNSSRITFIKDQILL